jgi:hypothetical protein
LHNFKQGIWKTLHPSNKFNQGISKNPTSIKQVPCKSLEKPYFHQTSSIKVFPKTLLPSNKFNSRYFKKPYFHQTSAIKIFRKTLILSNKCHQRSLEKPFFHRGLFYQDL